MEKHKTVSNIHLRDVARTETKMQLIRIT